MSEATLSVPVGPADHVRGPADAPLTLVEYGDYECPYCGQAHPIVQALIREFGDDLRFVFRNLPLSNVHPHAVHAAEVAEAVGLQDLFWPMHDMLFEKQKDLSDAALRSYAQEVGADVAAMEGILAGHRTIDRLRDDVESAMRSGANGTPTFFVNGARYDQSWDLQTFTANLRAAMGSLQRR